MGLRAELGGGGKNNKVLLKDALIWGFCSCCASIQEARVVDELNGVRVACCCKLEKTGGHLLVGEMTAVVRSARQGGQEHRSVTKILAIFRRCSQITRASLEINHPCIHWEMLSPHIIRL